MLRRDVRYQAAIVHEDHVLLLKVVDIDSGAMFWLLPGGGREAGESEEACVQAWLRRSGWCWTSARVSHRLRASLEERHAL